MTQNRSNTYHSAALWDAVRRDYEGGLTAEVAAERHGVHKRSLYRRAEREGWRKCDPLRPLAQADPEAPGQASLSRQTFDMVARNDRILEVMADSEGERLDLIVGRTSIIFASSPFVAPPNPPPWAASARPTPGFG